MKDILKTVVFGAILYKTITYGPIKKIIIGFLVTKGAKMVAKKLAA
jgi:hypothetical protein